MTRGRYFDSIAKADEEVMARRAKNGKKMVVPPVCVQQNGYQTFQCMQPEPSYNGMVKRLPGMSGPRGIFDSP